MFLFSQADQPRLLAPGVFASVPARHAEVARARGGFYVHHAGYGPEHARLLNPRPLCTAAFLWSFVGSVSTCPAVRAPLVVLLDDRAFTLDTTEWLGRQRWLMDGPGRVERSKALARYAEGLHQAKFIACPRGLGASSVRLFESMRVARCPVIVADEWLPPPFVDWDSCSIRVAERDLNHLPAILREREGEAEALGRRARIVWEQRYSPAGMLGTLAESCLDIATEDRSVGGRLRMAARVGFSVQTARKVGHPVRRAVGRA